MVSKVITENKSNLNVAFKKDYPLKVTLEDFLEVQEGEAQPHGTFLTSQGNLK